MLVHERDVEIQKPLKVEDAPDKLLNSMCVHAYFDGGFQKGVATTGNVALKPSGELRFGNGNVYG